MLLDPSANGLADQSSLVYISVQYRGSGPSCLLADFALLDLILAPGLIRLFPHAGLIRFSFSSLEANLALKFLEFLFHILASGPSQDQCYGIRLLGSRLRKDGGEPPAFQRSGQVFRNGCARFSSEGELAVT
jgi:hypothetical protein